MGWRLTATHAVMSEEDLALFNELLSSELGLVFTEGKREILESRLRPRLAALRLRSFRDYYLNLLYSNGDGVAERRALARAITNNETYFFRESYQFDALFEHAISDVKEHSARSGVIRMISAGCSSGEEPYTLNIHARENAYRTFGWTVEVDAFDVSDARVEAARQASYARSSLRAATPEQMQRYFHTSDGGYALKPHYRNGVRIRVGNVLDPSSYGMPGMTDVIFCRNVLIYFSESALRRAVSNFAEALRLGGLLFLGHSESIIGICPEFEPARFGNCIAYRRV